MTGLHSLIEHRANYYFLKLEDDYLAMFQRLNKEIEALELEDRRTSGPADCKAMIASVLEHWMNSKRATAKCEEDLYVYFTYDEWEWQLRGRYMRSTIIKCLKEMELEGQWLDVEGKYGPAGEMYTGTIKKRSFVQNTFEYMLNPIVIQGLLNALPEQSPYETYAKPALGRPRLNRVKLNDIKINGLKTDDGSVKIDDSRVKINAPFYTQITQTSQIDSSFVASAIAEDNGGNKNTLPGFDLEETTKHPAIKPKQADTEPLTQGKQFKTVPKRPKATPPKPELTPEEKALVARSTAIYNNIISWRGYAFDNGGAVINERKYCRKLAEKYSDDQVEKFYVHLTTKDFKWSKPNYRFKVGAYELYTEGPSVLQQLKVSDKKASNGHMPAVGPVTFDEWGNPDGNAILYGRVKFDHAAQQWWDNAAGKYLPVVN